MDININKIKELIIKHGELEEVELEDHATLIGDLQFDSIKIINLMVSLEDEFGIEFEDMELFIEKFEQVGSFISYVKTCIDES